MQTKPFILCILAIVFGQSPGWAQSEITKLEVTSSWVGEDISGDGDNYFLFNCSNDESLAGYLGTATISGNLRPVVYRDIENAELFYIERGDELYRIQRAADRTTYLYSDVSWGNASVEFSTNARDYEIESSTKGTTQVLATTAVGRVYSFMYRNSIFQSYRYLCSAGNTPSQVSFSNSGAREWVCISERQYEFRPKLDATVALVARTYPEGIPAEKQTLQSAYDQARVAQSQTAPQNSANTLSDEMLYAFDVLLRAFYAGNQNALQLCQLVEEASKLASDLKDMLGTAPADIKSAVTQACLALMNNNEAAIARELARGTDEQPTLYDVYRGYIQSSLDVYKELLERARQLGYVISDEFMTKIEQAITPEQYAALAVEMRDDFKVWLGNRLKAGQGFPKNTDLSLLLVNNSFELGKDNGWTVDPRGYWIMKGSDDVTSSESQEGWWSREYTHVLKSDTVGIANKVENSHGSFYWQAFDIHEYADNTKKKNIYHGHEISQTITGLPAGKYEVSALVALVKHADVSYGNTDAEKTVYLNAWVGEKDEGAGMVCNTSSFQKVSKQVLVSGPSDIVNISVCGYTATTTYEATKKLYRIIPFLVDNVQLTLVDANEESSGGNTDPEAGGQDPTPEQNQGTAFTFNETDVACPSFVVNAEYSSVVVNRTIKKSEYWNSLCLPFAISQEQTDDLFSDVRKLTGFAVSDEGVASLNFTQVHSIEAGKPYLVKVNGEKYAGGLTQLSAQNVTFVKEPIKETLSYINSNNETFYVSFVGVFNKVTGNYIPYTGMILQNNNFYMISEMTEQQRSKTSMKGFRCYFAFDTNSAQQTAPSFRLNMIEDEVTAIEKIERKPENEVVYDLQGRIVDQPVKGCVFIINGAKRIVR